jgi:hypothetical protein
MLTALQVLPRDAELLVFEAGCEDYCEREVDEVEWQGGACTCIWAPAGTTHREARRRSRCPRPVPADGPRKPRCGSGGRSAPARDPRQVTGSGQWVGPASPGWATMRKQRPGSGEKASA